MNISIKGVSFYKGTTEYLCYLRDFISKLFFATFMAHFVHDVGTLFAHD